jgi:large subunit ribosomal protein L10
MELQQKQEIVSILRDRFKKSSCVIMTDFQGMNVAALQKLRHEIKSKGFEIMVVKNTLLGKAAADLPFAADIKPYLKGMTAVTWSADDPSAPVKIFKEFQKEDTRLKIKCGILDGKVLKSEEVEILATMPSKTQAKAMFLGLLVSPAQQLLAQLQAPLANFLYLLEGYRKKKEKN